jgi:UDP-N-acetylmuramoylalanine--D-glutamate ligase
LLGGGPHTSYPAGPAAAAAQLAGIGDAAIAAGLCAFSGLEHRLEFVAEAGGVRYYNDSKSTTAESVACAVEAFDRNVFLIAGGRDKGCDFGAIKKSIARHVKGVRLIGEAAGRMAGEWAGSSEIATSGSLEEAIESVAAEAAAGDVVVFSPGCSSFDMFKNFEHRGNVFKDLVKRLAPGKEGRHA